MEDGRLKGKTRISAILVGLFVSTGYSSRSSWFSIILRVFCGNCILIASLKEASLNNVNLF